MQTFTKAAHGQDSTTVTTDITRNTRLVEEIVRPLGKLGFCLTAHTCFSFGTLAFRASNGSVETKMVLPFTTNGWGLTAELWKFVVESRFITGAIPAFSSALHSSTSPATTQGFSSSIGYKLIDTARWNVYPFVGFGAESIGNANGTVLITSMELGVGAHYFLPFFAPTDRRNDTAVLAFGTLYNVHIAYRHGFTTPKEYGAKSINSGGNLMIRLQIGIGYWCSAAAQSSNDFR
jgi:hypothetical protein